MLYLLYVLTFLAGILFYIMSPRDDQVNLDTYRAEGFIVSFLAQHQAAKDYMSQWLGFDLNHGSRASATSFSLTDDDDKFISYTPNGTVMTVSSRQGSAVTMGPDSDNNYRFLTSVFCLDNADQPTNCNAATKAYLATYSGSANRPSWWPSEHNNRQRRYGAWRTAITRRTNGSYNCGVLVCGQYWDVNQQRCLESKTSSSPGYWCVDNGQTVKLPNQKCAQKVPNNIIDALCPDDNKKSKECMDALFCISRVKTGPQKYYVSEGLISFYDGINNQKTGAEGNRSESPVPWEDLMRDNQSAGTTVYTGISPSPTADFSVEKIAAASGVIFPNLPISSGDTVFHDFTLTVLLKGNPPNDMDTILELINDSSYPWAVSLHLEKPTSGNPQVYFSVNGTKINDPSAHPLQNLDPNDKIISLTIIGSSDKLSVYINAKSEPVATLDATNSAISPYLTLGDLSDKKHLRISSSTESSFIYGVRYYNRAFGTTKRIKTTSGFTPSELEKNFKIDSKRYGIGVHKDYNPSIH